MKRLLITPLLALAIVAAACGSDDVNVTTVPPQDTTTTTEPPTTTTTGVPVGNEDGVLLQVSHEGGFAPMEMVVNRVPTFTLFTDGTIISQAATAAIFPGPVMTPLQQAQLDEQTMADVMALIRSIGLPDITELRNSEAANYVADATDTIVRYFDANGVHYVSVYALGIGGLPGDGGFTFPEQILELHELVELLSVEASTAEAELYEPDALQLVLLDPEQAFIDGEFANTIDWPFGDLAIEDFLSNGFVGCTTLDGAAAAAALEALADANSVTTYELDGAEHRILVRPLLPAEIPCAMLQR